MSKTATQIAMEEFQWGNLRRRRAEAFVALAMDALEDIIPDGLRRDAYHALVDAYNKAGIEALTDRDREEAGLAPRGELGWTPDELRALEAKRWEVMTRPMVMPIFPAKP